ncbi:hypothetical protein Patl1_31129 [Pistacia atlantica]|uniref:Uncharacterized protein n=1 Tax=Pistacia atlantica TaxID=434234 RepID=A0ACC1AAL2_9ROSI|nr:hypothetical protein Patl1_31129 [Pistacia atlantica]
MLTNTINTHVFQEYGMGSDVSMSGDVYSFGIMLLEMFTSKRPTEDMFSDGLTLHGYAKMALPEKVLEIIETSLLCEGRTRDARVKTEECLVSVVSIGVLCSMESPTDRMEMTDVVAKLCAIRKKFLGNRIN